MRRTIVQLPDALGDQSGFREALPSLEGLTQLGELFRLPALPAVATPEALWLGLPPGEAQMAQGPLTVSALGADPPVRSTHFHLSLLGHVDGKLVQPLAVVPDEELREVLGQAKRLNTRALTIVEGEHLDHALVWEGLGELQTQDPKSALGKSVNQAWPEGDAENMLRRFIDDSINLLSELEFNERRIDMGLAPLNVLWPWGHGVRLDVPNLALKRGEVASAASGSMRLAGLSRLAGYRHIDRSTVGRGTNTRFELLASTAVTGGSTLLVIDAVGEMLKAGKLEEHHWLLAELDRRLIAPLLEGALRQPSELLLVATGGQGGLAVRLDPKRPEPNIYPFDERSLEEPSLPLRDLWKLVDEALTGQ